MGCKHCQSKYGSYICIECEDIRVLINGNCYCPEGFYDYYDIIRHFKKCRSSNILN